MFKINGHTILLTRGDECTITLKVRPVDTGSNEEYAFKPGDLIAFGVYSKKGLDSPPLLLKEIAIEENTNIVNISLESSETKLGLMLNKPIEYWYEIQLNYKQTILGYDESGPKVLMLYPEGDDVNESGTE